MKYQYITESAELTKALSKLEKSSVLFIDTETTYDRARLLQVGDEEEIYVIDLFELKGYTDVLGRLFSKVGVVGHNLKFDLKYLWDLGIDPQATFDTYIASFFLGFERHSLRHLAEVLLGKTVDKSLQISDWSRDILTADQVRYAATDVFIVRELYRKMMERIETLPEADRGQELLKTRTARVFGLKNPALIVEMAFVREVALLEKWGLPVDLEEVEKLLKESDRKIQKKIMDFYIKYRVDPMSTKQIGNFLTQKLNLSLPETHKGNIATDDRALSMYSDVQEVREILEIRRLKKSIDKLRELENHVKNGRVYPEFKQIGAVTGRMASSNPNVQNIPREMRTLFRAEEGNLFVIADFSQIELRIAAEYVGDENMIRAFNEGKDLHRYTASLVLEKTEDEVTSGERQIAKAMNFGLIYGISARSLSQYAQTQYGADLDPGSAETLRRKFFQYFSTFQEWHEKVKKQLREEDRVEGTTLLGRPYSATTFTDAVNYPIQGTGADLLKLAVLLFNVEVRKRGLRARVVNLVHDEILVECPQEQAGEVAHLLESAMKRAGSIVLKKVPVEAEVNIDRSWSKG